MKTQLPANKQSAPLIPAPPTQDSKIKKNAQARWQGTPFSTERFSANRLPQLQAKMRVSQPHDPQEREADETAAKIMNMPDPTHDVGGDASGDSSSTGTGGDADGGLQRQTTGSASGSSSSIIVARSASTAPVIAEVRRSPEGGLLERREADGAREEREETEETQPREIARKVSTGSAEGPPSDAAGGDPVDASGSSEAGSDAAPADASNAQNDGADSGDTGAAAGAAGGESGGDTGINLSGNGTGHDGNSGVDETVEARIRALRGRGQPLHPGEKRFFESRFGRDFSRVRLHTDGQSQDLAKRVNAKAFAVGENIVFGRGYYQPGTRDGRELMAHELTHVVQQGKAPAIGARDAISANKTPAAKQIANAAAQDAKGSAQQTRSAKTNDAAKIATATPANAPVISRQAAEGEIVHRAPESEETNELLDKISGFADKFAGNIPGYRLVTLIIGFNPITRKTVQRTALNFVRAVAALIPGGDVLFERIQKSGVLVQAFNWLTKEFGKLGITLTLIKELLKTGLERVKGIGLLGAAISFLTGDLFPKVLRILKEVFGPTMTKLIDFVKKVAIKIKEFVFRGFLRLVGGREGPVFRFLNPIVNLLGRIFNDPISFGRNLLGAVGKGFKQFMGNFVKHFKGALFGWMFGTFSKAGIQVPTSFEPAAIFGFVAQLFAVTWTDIRAKIVKRMGPKGNTIMTAVEKSIEVVTILVTKGPQGLYEKIKQDLGSLKETILSAVLTWVRNTIIVKAIVKIASLLNPAGAIVQAILAIYNVVMFFIERFEQIKALVQGIMGALQDIVLGKIGPAANKVEQTMARALTLVISFLARLVGLGNIVKPVQKVIRRIKKRIDKAIDKIIRQITVRARVLWRRFKRKAKKVKDRIVNWWKFRKSFRLKNNESHSLQVRGKPPRARIVVASSPRRIPQIISAIRSLLKGRSTEGESSSSSPGAVGNTLSEAERLHQQISRDIIERPLPNTRRTGLGGRKETRLLNRLTSFARRLLGIESELRGGGGEIRDGIERRGTRLIFPSIDLPQFKAQAHRGVLYSNRANAEKLYRYRRYARGTPRQRDHWKSRTRNFRPVFAAKLRERIRNAFPSLRIENSENYKFRVRDSSERNHQFSGTIEDIVSNREEFQIPKWGKGSNSVHSYEVDHTVELQISGWGHERWANTKANWELVEDTNNSSSGGTILGQIGRDVRRYKQAFDDNRDVEDIKSKFHIHYRGIRGTLPGSVSRSQFWTLEEIEKGDHIDELDFIPDRRRRSQREA